MKKAAISIRKTVGKRRPVEKHTRPGRSSKTDTLVEARAPKTAYFSFHHPDLVPGGQQTIAKKLHDEHLLQHGPKSSVFIAAMIGGGPKRPAGSDLIQLAPQEFVYVTPNFDYQYFTNFDDVGQLAVLELLDSFEPSVLHFHHFMGFGIDFIQACLSRFDARSVFTVHEHMLVCQNDGHLLQKNNNHICKDISYARCSTCLPHFRYDYFQHRMAHFSRVMSQFDEITAVSAFTAELVGKALGLPEPISVIPNGPILGPITSSSDDLSMLRIAFIGQIHPTKGVHLLLESVLAICKADVRAARRIDIALWGNFISSEEYRSSIDQAIAELASLKVPVTVNGAYHAADLPALLADRNVVVVPSQWPESYCLTADEALQMGKILVCSDFPAIRERFDPSDSVLYFPIGSAGGLRMRLTELLERQEVPRASATSTRGFSSFADIYRLYTATYGVSHAN